VVLHAVTSLTLATEDGESLEAVYDSAHDATGVIVLCHPHPQYGGTMRTPMFGAIAKHALSEGFDVLRFNFRGVGESTGVHGDGQAELSDIDAAMAYALAMGVPVVGLTGWSFGAAVSLNWQAETGSSVPYVGIAPPVTSPLTPRLPEPSRLRTASRGFVIGDRDQFIRADDLAAYAASISAKIIRYPTTDHFFVLRHKKLAEDVVGMLSD
jgi:alpha/beta superfamily hydrolase